MTATKKKDITMTDINDIIERAKSLQEFTVTYNVPEEFRFKGVVPFSLVISEGVATCSKVLALTYEEAEEQVANFFSHSTDTGI